MNENRGLFKTRRPLGVIQTRSLTSVTPGIGLKPDGRHGDTCQFPKAMSFTHAAVIIPNVWTAFQTNTSIVKQV